MNCYINRLQPVVYLAHAEEHHYYPSDTNGNATVLDDLAICEGGIRFWFTEVFKPWAPPLLIVAFHRVQPASPYVEILQRPCNLRHCQCRGWRVVLTSPDNADYHGPHSSIFTPGVQDELEIRVDSGYRYSTIEKAPFKIPTDICAGRS